LIISTTQWLVSTHTINATLFGVLCYDGQCVYHTPALAKFIIGER